MKKFLRVFILIIVVGLIYLACNLYFLYQLAPNGTKAYSTYTFPISKYYLEKRIDSLILFDKKILRTVLDNDPTEKFYNTGRYFTINIDSIEYIFRYKGDSLDWDNSKHIEIFLTSINSSKKRTQSDKEKLEIVQKIFIDKLR